MQVGLAVQVALVTAIGGLLAGFAATAVAVQTFDLGAALALRTIVVAAVVVLGTWLLVRRRVLSAHRTTLCGAALVGLLIGYGINPFAWIGRAFFAQLFFEPGTLTMVLDLAGWVVLGALAAVVASRRAPVRDEPLGYEPTVVVAP